MTCPAIWSVIFMFDIFSLLFFLVRQFQVLHFQSTRHCRNSCSKIDGKHSDYANDVRYLSAVRAICSAAEADKWRFPACRIQQQSDICYIWKSASPDNDDDDDDELVAIDRRQHGLRQVFASRELNNRGAQLGGMSGLQDSESPGSRGPGTSSPEDESSFVLCTHNANHSCTQSCSSSLTRPS